MIVSKLSLLISLISTVQSHSKQALKFHGHDTSSYIMINPDMSPLEEAASVCMWIKKLTYDHHTGTILHYRTARLPDVITVSDNLRMAVLVYGHTSNTVRPAMLEWYHVCLTWSRDTQRVVVYHNGVETGSKTIPGDWKFIVKDGSLVLGQYHRTSLMQAYFSPRHPFKGEITKLNILKRELSAKEVDEMFISGICSDYEDSLQDDIHLSWETLLSDETEKHGNVRPIDLSCPDHTHEPTKEKATTAGSTTKKSTTVGSTEESTGCADRWAIFRLPDFYNKEVETGVLQDLENKTHSLEVFIGYEITDDLKALLLIQHCTGTGDSDNCEQDWSFLDKAFFQNQKVTADMIKDLRRKWKLLAEFSGHVIDDALIAHLEKHHCTTES